MIKRALPVVLGFLGLCLPLAAQEPNRTAKFDRKDKQAYIIGSVGNEKVQITAGAAYEESSGNVPRPRLARAARGPERSPD